MDYRDLIKQLFNTLNEGRQWCQVSNVKFDYLAMFYIDVEHRYQSSTFLLNGKCRLDNPIAKQILF